jgi:hypothetical protein
MGEFQSTSNKSQKKPTEDPDDRHFTICLVQKFFGCFLSCFLDSGLDSFVG